MSTKHNLKTIEVARGIAALLVVFFHATGIIGLEKYYGEVPFDGFFEFGDAGVDFFFVLSGFIIYYSSSKYLGRLSGLRQYLVRRFLRIYPIYWIVALVLLPVSIFVFGHAISPATALADLLLLPRDGMPFIPVAWTLKHEILFYALFGLFFIHVRVAMAAFVLWQAAIVAAYVGNVYVLSPFMELILSPHNIEFFLGVLVAIYCRKNAPLSTWLLPLGLLLWSVAMAIDMSSAPAVSEDATYLFYGVASAVVILGLVAVERVKECSCDRVGLLLGEASYSIYLVHFAVLSATIKVVSAIAPAMPVWLVFILLSLAGVAGGIAVHVVVERRLLAAARSISTRMMPRGQAG